MRALTAIRWPTLTRANRDGARTVRTAPFAAVTRAFRFASFATTTPLKLAALAVPVSVAAMAANAANAMNLFMSWLLLLFNPAGPLARTELPLRHGMYRQCGSRPLSPVSRHSIGRR